nr:unnamed protein product [Digitaria exilis]
MALQPLKWLPSERGMQQQSSTQSIPTSTATWRLPRTRRELTYAAGSY